MPIITVKKNLYCNNNTKQNLYGIKSFTKDGTYMPKSSILSFSRWIFFKNVLNFFRPFSPAYQILSIISRTVNLRNMSAKNKIFAKIFHKYLFLHSTYGKNQKKIENPRNPIFWPNTPFFDPCPDIFLGFLTIRTQFRVIWGPISLIFLAEWYKASYMWAS